MNTTDDLQMRLEKAMKGAIIEKNEIEQLKNIKLGFFGTMAPETKDAINEARAALAGHLNTIEVTLAQLQSMPDGANAIAGTV